MKKNKPINIKNVKEINNVNNVNLKNVNNVNIENKVNDVKTPDSQVLNFHINLLITCDRRLQASSIPKYPPTHPLRLILLSL